MERKSYYHVSTEITKVMANIERYVIPENRRAIEYLWDNNILTTQTNDYDNEDSWIAVGKLSDENNQILYDYANRRKTLPEEVGYIGLLGYGNGFKVPIKPGDKDTFEAFKVLFDLFKPQDVQKDGYMTVEEFYVKCTDCKKRIMNPNYHPLPHPNIDDYDDPREYSKAFERYAESVTTIRTIEVFDPEKCVKDLTEYLEDAGLADCYDEEEGKIFLNRRLYEGHMRYKKLYGDKKERSI